MKIQILVSAILSLITTTIMAGPTTYQAPPDAVGITREIRDLKKVLIDPQLRSLLRGNDWGIEYISPVSRSPYQSVYQLQTRTSCVLAKVNLLGAFFKLVPCQVESGVEHQYGYDRIVKQFLAILETPNIAEKFNPKNFPHGDFRNISYSAFSLIAWGYQNKFDISGLYFKSGAFQIGTPEYDVEVKSDNTVTWSWQNGPGGGGSVGNK